MFPAMWPMYQFFPHHNAVLSGPPAVTWTRRMGGKINGGLAYANGTIYVESFDARVSALNARTGAVRWSTAVDNVVMTTPIIGHSVLVVGTGTSQVLSESAAQVIWGRLQGDAVIGLDVASGRILWRHPTMGEDMPSPALTRVGNVEAVVFANGDNHIYALDLHTGRTIWRRPVNGIATMSSAALDRGTVFLVVGNTSYSRIGDSVLAIDPATGVTVWRAPYGNADCSPTVAYGRVFVEGSAIQAGLPASRNASNDVMALDEGTGKLHWRWYSGLGTFTSIGSDEQAIGGMAADGGFYEAIPATNEFAAFDARSGKVRWKIRTRAAVKMSAVEKDGRLYFGDTGNTLYTVDARSGRVIARKTFPSFFSVSSPLIVGNTLYVANNTVVYALPFGTK